MGRSYLEVSSALGGSGISFSTAPMWSTTEIDNVATVFDKLNGGQQITQSEIDKTTELLARGLEDPNQGHKVGTLISELYSECDSPQARARIIGLLLSPEGQSVLQQMLQTPDAQDPAAQTLSPEERQQLLEITAEPNSTLRMEALFELVRSKLPEPEAPGIPRGPGHEASLAGTRTHESLTEEQASSEGSIKKIGAGGDSPPQADLVSQTALSSQPASDSSGRSTGDTLPPLQDAIRDVNTPQVKLWIDQSPQPVDIMNQFTSLGSQAMPALTELIQDPKYRNFAHSVILKIGSTSNQSSVQEKRTSNSPPVPHTQAPSIVDTSQLEHLLASPETIPSTLGTLVRMGRRGQASLCELLVSL